MSQSHTIGKWTCPSGNQVDAQFTPNNHKGGEVTFLWDEGPPLTPDDEVYYLQVIRPHITRKVLALISGKNE